MISPKSVSLLVPKPFPWPHSGNKSKTCGRNQSEMASPECFSTIHPWVLSEWLSSGTHSSVMVPSALPYSTNIDA